MIVRTAFRSPEAFGLLAGFLAGAIELAVLVLWHPGRQPLGLDARGWLRGGTLVLALYAGAGLCLALIQRMVFAGAFRRRGSRGDEDARRSIVFLVLLAGLALGFLWWSRFLWISGASFFSVEKLLRAAALLILAMIVSATLTSFLVTNARWSPALAATSLSLLGISTTLFPPAQTAARPAANGPSVLLIVADALRADRLGCYADGPSWSGRRSAPTPHLDALAARGTVLTRYFVTAPYTWASFAGLFLGRGTETLPEYFAERGYETAAFLSGTLTNGSGLTAGFDTIYEDTAARGPFRMRDPWSVVCAELVPFRLWSRWQSRLDRERVVTEAIEWIEERDRPFFAFVHLFSTHTPYDPPAAHRLEGSLPRFDADMARRIESGEWIPTREEIESIRALYDGTVAWTDAQVGRLLAAIGDRVIVVFTSDHGEELADHEWNGRPCFEHDWMWNTNLRVPFLAAGPGVEPGLRIDEVRSARDVFPWLRGEIELDGRIDTFAISENALYVTKQDRRWKVMVEKIPPHRRVVWDLERDPMEQNPIGDLSSCPAWVSEDFVSSWETILQAPADGETAEALRAFGYLGKERDRRMLEDP